MNGQQATLLEIAEQALKDIPVYCIDEIVQEEGFGETFPKIYSDVCCESDFDNVSESELETMVIRRLAQKLIEAFPEYAD